MELFEGSQSFSSRKFDSPVVAIGIFDGVHLGHQELMRRARMEAKRRGCASVVYTFEPHPVKVLSPDQCPKLLTTREQKQAQLAKLGIDALVVEQFTRDFASQGPGKFFDDILQNRLRASCVVIGYDFTFGMHRQGTIETFEEMGKKCGMSSIVVPAVFADETLISSTVIRSMISAGEVKRARSLLGRPYEALGNVVPGRGFGSALAARTANLSLASEISPKDGVYITRTLVHHEGYGKTTPDLYESVTSIGQNPTFADLPRSFETHLIDADADLLGKTLSVEFLERIRDQEKFISVEDLRNRIHQDIDVARKYHGRTAR